MMSKMFIKLSIQSISTPTRNSSKNPLNTSLEHSIGLMIQRDTKTHAFVHFFVMQNEAGAKNGQRLIRNEKC